MFHILHDLHIVQYISIDIPSFGFHHFSMVNPFSVMAPRQVPHARLHQAFCPGGAAGLRDPDLPAPLAAPAAEELGWEDGCLER